MGKRQPLVTTRQNSRLLNRARPTWELRDRHPSSPSLGHSPLYRHSRRVCQHLAAFDWFPALLDIKMQHLASKQRERITIRSVPFYFRGGEGWGAKMLRTVTDCFYFFLPTCYRHKWTTTATNTRDDQSDHETTTTTIDEDDEDDDS